MEFVGWIAAIALGYIVFGRILFLIADGVAGRKWSSFVALAVGLAIGGAFAVPSVAMIGLRVDKTPGAGFLRPWHPWFDVALGFSLVVGLVLASKLVDGKPDHRDRKRRKELSRQIKLHMALTTGALLFSVPFYWLVTTSLKPDDRVFVLPPTLLPTEQERVKIAGEPRKVFWLEQRGEDVKVAKMAEMENDKWLVRTLGPGLQTPDHRPTQFVVRKKELREVLHPTAKWSNYSDVLNFVPPEYARGLRPLWNTVYVTLLTILGTVFSSSLVAFSFARLRWPGRDMLFVVLIATMMIPAAVTMLPVFLIFRSLGWIDTLRPLWFPALFGGAFNVFLLRQFFMTIPNDLEEAAKIDGCGYFTIYWRIMLPLIKPALAAITIFAFMGSWNNFMGPLIYINSPENMTLAFALQLFQGAHGGEPAMMMAAATLVMLPVLVVFFITQRYMIQGVTLTGLKA